MASRPVSWCDFLMNFNMVDGAVTLDNLLVNAPSNDTRTITRLIGDFKVVLSAVSEVETQQVVDVGIGVINKEAFDLGTGVGVPNPTVEDSYPPRGWLYVARDTVLQALPTGGTVTAMWRETPHFKFDIRGQRKVDKGVLFMWSEANVTAGSTSTPNAIGRVRVLYKD